MIVREEDRYIYISYAIICIIHLHFHLVVKKEREKVFLERRTNAKNWTDIYERDDHVDVTYDMSENLCKNEKYRHRCAHNGKYVRWPIRGEMTAKKEHEECKSFILPVLSFFSLQAKVETLIILNQSTQEIVKSTSEVKPSRGAEGPGRDWLVSHSTAENITKHREKREKNAIRRGL